MEVLSSNVEEEGLFTPKKYHLVVCARGGNGVSSEEKVNILKERFASEIVDTIDPDTIIQKNEN